MKKITLFLGALAATFLWGSAFPCLKTGYNILHIDNYDIGGQLVFAGIRFSIAGIAVLILGMLMGKKIFLQKSDKSFLQKWKLVILFAFVNTFLQYFFYYIGLANVSGTKGAIFNSLGTMLMVIFGVIYYKTKLFGNKLFGVILGLSGVLVLCVSGVSGRISIIGDGMLLASSVFAAIGIIVNKETTLDDDPVIVTGWHLFIGGIMLLVVGILLHGTFTFDSIKAIILIGYMSFISAATCTIWSWLLKHNPVENVAIYKFMVPIFGTLLSCIFLHETINWQVIVALLLVCAGIILVQAKDNEKKIDIEGQ